MRNLYITLGFMLATGSVMAQSDATKDADKLFDRLEYVDAAQEYLKLDKKDPYVQKQLAESYYNMYNTKEAVKWFAEVVKKPQDAETYYKYAQMLKAEGKYEEANAQMQKFASLAPADQRAVEFKKDPNYLPTLRKQAKLFNEKVLDINDKKYGSFGGVLANDNTFYFTSARNTARKKYGVNEEPYLDIYQSTYNANGTYSEPIPVTDVNSRWHDGPVAITADGNTMYFTSESFNEKEYIKDKEKKIKQGQLYLYKATKVNGRWENITELPFNNKKWSTGNPSVSKDGKWLYFASDREGSMGGSSDIWKVEITGKNSYGQPVNLGPKVNTEGKENFPFIADDGKLYFSTDGKKGFGSLDVYVIDLKKSGAEAQNLGAPVNTNKDDFAFTYNLDKKLGYFSSNRDGFDKIYEAKPLCAVEALVVVTDIKTGAVIPGAAVAILDEKGNVIERRTAGTDGTVEYGIDCDRAYTIQASAEGYEGNAFPIEKTPGGEVKVDAKLKPVEKPEEQIVLNDIYFEYNKSNITKEGAFELDKVVETMKKFPDLVIMVKSHTDSRGSDQYNMNLSNRRAKSTVQYVISRGISKDRISGQGYGESEPKVQCTECTEEQHAQNRRSEFLVVKK